ncbi:MAG: hypothetical protein KJO69_09410 [Gammaproteobacteria bacterium]|nr:hypothetical protein [Gammaproteobacteria bacterium]
MKIHAIDTDKLKDKIVSLKKRMTELKALEEKIQELPDKQISLTDPEARSMRSNSETAGVIGYNVQSAVDTEHHLIVAHEVNNVGIDRAQLFNMAMKAEIVLEVDDLIALSDRGYYRGEQLLACEQAGIVTYVPKANTSGARADGRFDRNDFRYIHEDDQYACPAGKRLINHMSTNEKGRIMYRYWRSGCTQCHLKRQCTPGKERRVTRWEQRTS